MMLQRLCRACWRTEAALRLSTLLSLIPLVGCSSTTASSSSGDSVEAGAPSACAQDTRKDVYVPGLSKSTAGGLALKIVAATPDPPGKLTNSMTLQLSDAEGRPVDGVTLAVVPFMPDHGHGSSVKPRITPKGAGAYEITNLYYPMPGLWRITVTVQPAEGSPQDVAFSFCIDG